MSIRAVVTVSDLHCGGTGAIHPPEFEDFEGNVTKANPRQSWLWGNFLAGLDKLAATLGDEPILMVHNGDAVDGYHHGTDEITTKRSADMIRLAQECLEEVEKRLNVANWVFTIGTECHVTTAEQVIGELMGALPHPDTGHFAEHEWSLRINGLKCTWRHHITTSSRHYLRGSRLSIHLGNQQLNEIYGNEEPTRVLTAAHCHLADYYDNGRDACATTPSWQLPTKYVHKVVPGARCRSGFLLYDWRERDEGELPEHRFFTFVSPARTVLAL